jgi:3-hydroxyisobutyrate dehydrogenase-like beta-hydroxyacid dehydrogenase
MEQSVAGSADVILSCLIDDQAVLGIYQGANGVFANARPGTLAIDLSTVRPQTSQQLSASAQDFGVDLLDVAISGSSPAAEAGTLTLLAGGDQHVFEAVTPILRTFSKQAFYMGPSGSGTTMKLVANTLLGVGLQAIAEAAALGEKAGIDRNLLLDVMAKLAVIAPAHAGKLERAKVEDYGAQFPIRLMTKDFRLILEKAHEVGASMPATAAAQQINNVASMVGPEEDFSAVIRTMERMAGLEPEKKAA